MWVKIIRVHTIQLHRLDKSQVRIPDYQFPEFLFQYFPVKFPTPTFREKLIKLIEKFPCSKILHIRGNITPVLLKGLHYLHRNEIVETIVLTLADIFLIIELPTS